MAQAKTGARGVPKEDIPIDYRTIDRITGPLLFVKDVADAAYGEMVEISLPDGTARLHHRRDAIVQQVEQALGELGTHGLETHGVGTHHQHGADDFRFLRSGLELVQGVFRRARDIIQRGQSPRIAGQPFHQHREHGGSVQVRIV